ncbi:response regulator transcription factor [Clostridium sardiniense]|uniref:Stage 0 sporulation protein A homolog n=1 Tax=Clostridium sardiniense TaxID=29369 RepID=A0ABS7KWX3_CLOSR|nr:response regulator transcription factor [Clostridium sardiniense]MBY0755304.1 response regulator transcription factor [Clostridium sardiniense]MDQ0459749.1 DNA-binding NarL/FixJ family response regulator [Clostridium sardiniense]
MTIRLVIGEDDDLIRESLKIILGTNQNIEVLDAFPNGREALEYVVRNDVDIALLDVRMPIMNGVLATKEINEKSNTKVIILTTFDEDDYIRSAISYGAKGYLLKNTPPDKIISAIEMVYAGNSVIQEEVLSKLSSNLDYKEKEEFDMTQFTEREIEIIKEISKGASNKEISSSLFISEGTVKNYITSILQKTGLSHRTQIAIKYLKSI